MELDGKGACSHLHGDKFVACHGLVSNFFTFGLFLCLKTDQQKKYNSKRNVRLSHSVVDRNQERATSKDNK